MQRWYDSNELFLVEIQGGKRPEVVDIVLTRFASEPDETTRELLSLTALFASLAFTDPQDRQWLERRLAMLEDILSEAPLYKSLIAQGEEKGLKKGREEGREEGRILSALNTLTVLFQESFPQLHTLAQETLSAIKDPNVLEKLIIRVARARDEKEARKYLLEVARPKGM